MSALAGAMKIVRTTFDKYAGKEGDKKTLTKTELSDLLKVEIFGGATPEKSDVDGFFKALDNDGDGVVDFNEYVVLVATLTMLCAP